MKIKYTVRKIKAGDYCYYKNSGDTHFSRYNHEIDKVLHDKVHFKIDSPGLWYTLDKVRLGKAGEKNDGRF